MASITAIVSAYRRPQNILPLVQAIRTQSVPPEKIWAWANEPDGAISGALAAAGFDRVVTSSENTMFHGRFALALLARTEYVAIFDDDSIPGENWFANCLATMRHTPGILGTAGIALAKPGYRERTMLGWQRPCDAAIEVDLVCQAWFLRVEWVRHLFAAPAVLGTNGEDIELAARAWRVAGIRSFCPPHPANDASRWGSTRGMELGIDEVAASLRTDHLDQRERIVKAEIEAGWRPLCLRDPPATQRWITNRPVDVQFPNETLERIELGSMLEKVRDPLGLLRQARERLSLGGVLTATFANVRHKSVIEALFAGRWQPHRGPEESDDLPANDSSLRYFTRREVEKLLDRGGFSVSSFVGLPSSSLDVWPAEGMPGEVALGTGCLRGLSREETEGFYVERYRVEAAREERPSFALTSIVIVTHNQLAYTRACLESIRFVTDEPYELIVVDNGSTDDTPQYVGSMGDVRLIANADNRGFPAAANQGILAASGQQILLLNNDVLVTTGWLRRMLDALRFGDAGGPTLTRSASEEELGDGLASASGWCEAVAHPVGLVGPCSNYVSGPQQIPVGYDDISALDGFAWEWAKHNAGRREEVDRLVGFCLLISREVVDRVGLLDERFGIGNFEDDDFCRRAGAAGFRRVIARDAFVHHFGHRSFAAAGVDLAALLEHNKRLYEEKWAAEGTEQGTGDRGQVTEMSATPTVPCSLSPVTCPLSLCMIVRQNARTIRACLESIKPWVDEMIVVDTGSTDETPVICRELGAQVHRFPWPDSFSIARNESIKYANGEWIFWMDSDDAIDAENGRRLRQLASGTHALNTLGYVMQVHCPGGDMDGAHDVTVVDHLKLFRNRRGLRFEGRIHEQVLDAINRAGGDVVFTDIFVVHSGADHSREGRRNKLKRDIRLLRLDLRERPNHTFVHFNLGMTYADAGKHRKAVEALNRSLQLAQPHESHVRKVYALLAASHRELGQKAEARRACADGLRFYPKDPELLFRQAMLLHEDGRLRDAERSYLAALSNDDELHFSSIDRGIVGFKARHNLAAVYTDMGALHKAEEQWRRIVEEVPTYRDGWRGLVENLLLQQKPSDARQAVERVLATDGRLRGLGLALSARVAEATGQIGTALATLREARRQCADDVAPLDELCRLLFYGNDSSELEEALRELVRRQPHNAAAHQNLGTLLLRSGRFHEAAETFRASLRERPDSALTHLSLGYALSNSGKDAEAGDAFQRCVRLAPDERLVGEAQRQLSALALI